MMNNTAIRKYKKANILAAKQSGAALFISLILLMALTIIGLSAANRSNLQKRMATNMHIQNLTFNAAESAVGAFVVDSFTGNKLLAGHVLYDLRINGSLSGVCYDQSGIRVACSGVYLDGDRAGSLKSEVNVTVLSDCNPAACGGFSLGEGSNRVGCRVFKIDGEGTLGNQTSTTSLWAYEITSCG